MTRVVNRRPPAISILTYLVLGVFVLLALFPFFYMLSLSLQSDADLFSGVPVIIPSQLQFSNYVTIWDKAPFARFIVNSFVIAGGITFLHLLFDPLVGYVFAKLEFPGKRFMFASLLSTLMLPFFIRMIPLYILTAELGWLDTYQGLIMPFAMSAYGIFMMRQFIRPIPVDLLDAARLDGASEWRIYRAIVLPQLGPPMATLGLLTFVFQFNEFLWPLVVVSSVEMRPITTGLTLFNSEFFTQWNLTATGGVILFVPSLLLFVFMQRFFVQSVMMSGMK
ncbi:multiple sugar transport system permease protein [Rhizobium sp. BK529]|uniref:carbohydrate ABC transporter permease n=1 Tax=unclassified Rhizobium TaxID=2613769 RepID=UPI001051196F|nr:MULTISPECIES: carbohydrate ABC transporter permease [unclassified Rhizobium]MBB3593269.1 multiple sugar transport system permease protein [Rhizobium sp. BK529]TCS03069.1 carbohydrate ABC transporter membrane protein 2 (CUT1 family) [Rhizobium sp. BK418]